MKPVLCFQVHLGSGALLDTVAVRRLLQNLPLADSLSRVDISPQTKESKELESSGSLTNVYLDAALAELMGRYGTLTLKDPIKFDGGLSNAGSAVSGLIDGHVKENGGLQLRLLVEKVRNVQGMDFGLGADLFCVAFVADWSSGTGVAIGKGNRLFQTEIRRGKSETDWIWNEVSAWHCVLAGCLYHVRRKIRASFQ